MNPVLEEILRTRYVKSTNGELIKLHSNISPAEGKFLYEIVSEIKPEVSLEIGLAYGISALFICEALYRTPYARHIIIDAYQLSHPKGDSYSWKGIGLNNVREAGYGETIEFHNQQSHTALPQLEARGLKIDFAFIDGNHLFDYALIDFFYIDRMLRVGGIVALDDADWPGIRKLCRYIVTNQSYCVFRCLRPKHGTKTSLKRYLHKISKPFWERLKLKNVESDIELGLVPGSSCIAFKKESYDTRRWDFHSEF